MHNIDRWWRLKHTEAVYKPVALEGTLLTDNIDTLIE